MVEVNNKVLLITGGANGIGAAVVKMFLLKGCKHVTFLDIDKTTGLKFEKELAEEHGKDKIKFIECDVSDDEQLFGAYDSVIKDKGYIDVIINNAGVAETCSDNYKKIIDINFRAVVTSTIKGLEFMRKDQGGRGGTIINISSIAALLQMSPMVFVYFGTKSAVLQFSNCIGNYYTRTGVRVVTVCFGCTDTDILHRAKIFDKSSQQEMEEIFKSLPLQSVESASRGLIEVYQAAESGDTWLVNNDKPALNITDKVKKAYQTMSEDLEI